MPDAGSRPGNSVGPVLNVCVLGGTPAHAGGLEAYCDRAVSALRKWGKVTRVRPLYSHTAYLRPRSAAGILATLRTVVRERSAIDLMWLQVSNLPDLGYLALARFLRIPVLVTPHFGANSLLQTRPARRSICRWLLAKADAIATLFSQQDQEIELPGNVARSLAGTFLPEEAVAGDLPPPSHAQARLLLIHAARFSAPKGTFDMIDLCARLHKRGVDFEARLVGRADATTMREIREAIAKGGVEGRVSLTEWLDEEQMQAAFRNADVLVHLSRLDSFPLVVLEALAANTLPIVRPMLGSRSIVSDFGGYVAERSDAVEDACDWLCGQTLETLRGKGKAAGALVRTAYGWPRLVERLEDIFKATWKQAARA